MNSPENVSTAARLLVRLYAASLFAYPRRFRAEFGPWMVQAFRDCCREAYASRGTRGLARCAGWAAADLLSNASMEWGGELVGRVRAGWPAVLAGVAAVTLGCVCGWIDRHSDEVQPAVLALVVANFTLSALVPRAAWRWVILTAFCLPATTVLAASLGWGFAYPVGPDTAAWSLLALIPSAVGAGAGVLVRLLVTSGRGFRPAAPLLALFLLPADLWAQEIDADAVDSFVAESFRTDLGDAPAAFVLVKDGRIIYRKGNGFEDAARRVPVDPDLTVFHAASVGKLVTATAVMQLVEGGRLGLDQDVNLALARFRLASDGEPVTVAHLLTHTGGFAERFLGGMAATPGDVVPLGDYLAARMPPRVRPPGVQITYSNHGMALAGYLVEEATGEPFAAAVERTIFRPLGMTRSSFRQPLPADLAARLVADRRGPPPALNASPAGSLATTPADMARFLLAHLEGGATGSGRVLRPETVALMHRRHFSAHPDMPGVALGFFEGEVSGRRVLFHTGDRGHHSLALLLPEERLGFYLVYAGGDTPARPFRETLTRRFFDRFYPAAKPFSQPPSPPDFAARAGRYTGLYRASQCPATGIERAMGITRQFRVRDGGDGTLRTAMGLGGPEETLVETGPGLFRTADGEYVSFRGGEPGRATLLDYSGGVDDPGGATRIGWYEDGVLHVALLLLAGAVIGVRCLVLVGGGLRRLLKGGRPGEARGPRLAWRVSGVAGVLAALTPVVLVATLLLRSGPVYSLTWGQRAALTLPTVAVVVGLVCGPFAAVAVRRGWWSVRWRVYYVLLALAFVVAAAVIGYWGLLGVPG